MLLYTRIIYTTNYTLAHVKIWDLYKYLKNKLIITYNNVILGSERYLAKC